MKKTRIYKLFMLGLLTGLGSCDKDDDNQYPQLGNDPMSITQLVAQDSELSSFSSAMAEVDLDSILGQSTTYTVFAPHNAASQAIEHSVYSQEQLKNLWYNHVLSTVTADFSQNLTTGYRTTMATGPDDTNLSIFISSEQIPTINGLASFVSGSFDLGATNGVLHVVDGVLVPPTIVNHAQANPAFSMFTQAIELSGLSDELSITEATDSESKDYPLTVFAPNNSAFEAILAEFSAALGWSALTEVPVEVLQEIVLYHVVPGENSLSEEVPGTEQTSMQGGVFSIDAEGVISDASYSTARITTADVQAVNGILHGVDKVLLPESVFQDLLGATLNLAERMEDRGFSNFLTAMEKVALSGVLETEELTAFAPNNDAFTALFASIENFESLDDFNTPEELETLKALLNYHLHENLLMSDQFTDGDVIRTIHGDVITVDLSGDVARLRPSYLDAIPSGLVSTDIGASNGVIHEINRILIPDALVDALGFPLNEGGRCEVGDPSLVFFDWNGRDPYWGNVTAENDPSLSIDGESYGRANFQTGGTGWTDLFWRNGGTLNGGEVVGTQLEDYSLKFDINVMEPIDQGVVIIRFNDSQGVDAMYQWAPWTQTGEAFTTDGWETVEIPLSVLGAPDFSLIDAEFGMAFQEADVLLNFAIDNVRFDTPGCEE